MERTCGHTPTLPARGRHRGAGLVEYLIIVGLVAVVALAGARRFGTTVDGRVTAQAACVESLACGGLGSGSAIQAGSEDAPLLGAGQIRAGATAIGTADVPASKPLLARVWDGVRGFFVDGVWGTVTGVWQIITHPIETVEGLWTAVTNPVQQTAPSGAISKAWNDNPRFLRGSASRVSRDGHRDQGGASGRLATATGHTCRGCHRHAGARAGRESCEERAGAAAARRAGAGTASLTGHKWSAPDGRGPARDCLES